MKKIPFVLPLLALTLSAKAQTLQLKEAVTQGLRI